MLKTCLVGLFATLGFRGLGHQQQGLIHSWMLPLDALGSGLFGSFREEWVERSQFLLLGRRIYGRVDSALVRPPLESCVQF